MLILGKCFILDGQNIEIGMIHEKFYSALCSITYAEPSKIDGLASLVFYFWQTFMVSRIKKIINSRFLNKRFEGPLIQSKFNLSFNFICFDFFIF